MKQNTKELLFSTGLILLIGVITYLPFLHLLGVYHDDWKLFTPLISQKDFPTLFSSDRPAIGYFYEFFVKPLGYSLLNWQLFSLGLNFAATLAFYFFCRLLLGGKNLLSTMMAILFFIFPGFYQQSNAITYSTQYLPLFLGLLSIDLMFVAIKKIKIVWRFIWITLAVLCQLLFLSLSEYFIGLEVIRLIVLWIVVARENPALSMRGKVKITLLNYLPYIIASFAFLYWRFFIFHATRSTVSPEVVFATLISHPMSFLFNLSVDLFRNYISAAGSVWTVPVTSSFSGLANKEILLTLIISVVSTLIVFFGMRFLERFAESEKPVGKLLLTVGGVTILLCLFPIVLAGRDIAFSSGYDRYTVPALIGSILLVGGLISYTKRSVFRICFSALVFISVATQVNMQLKAANYWQAHKDFWWQLAWRAPDLKDNTILIPVTTGDAAFWDIWEIFVPANLIYRGENQNLELFSEILNNTNYREILNAQSKEVLHRSIYFNVDFKNALIISMPYDNKCLHVWDSSQLELSPGTPALQFLAASSSNLAQIDAAKEPAIPQQKIFGKEPDRDWCYYFEKASLARQKADWQEISRLAGEISKRELHPVDRIEWIPFLEGLINTGETTQVQGIVTEIRKDYQVQQSLCEQYTKQKSGAYSSQVVFVQMVSLLCSP
jgi:hypothetical protein